MERKKQKTEKRERKKPTVQGLITKKQMTVCLNFLRLVCSPEAAGLTHACARMNALIYIMVLFSIL